MYVTEAEEEIYHTTDTTTYIKPKTIVCQNNLSNIAVLKMTKVKIQIKRIQGVKPSARIPSA